MEGRLWLLQEKLHLQELLLHLLNGGVLHKLWCAALGGRSALHLQQAVRLLQLLLQWLHVLPQQGGQRGLHWDCRGAAGRHTLMGVVMRGVSSSHARGDVGKLLREGRLRGRGPGERGVALVHL